MPPFPYQRIVVVGVTGCGKSTMAERLAAKLALEFIELDALFWKPGWFDSTREEFREKVEAATHAPRWALAGNYGMARDIVWPRAEAAVWLDYSFFLVFGRLLRRTWVRWRTKELLWGTNYEPFWVHFKLWSKDSLINWMFQTYWRRKRTYPQFFAMPEYSHLKVFRFKTPRERETWLETSHSTAK
ncbi:MAG: AAA family ATPase [Chloroflexi bacterium]|nr:AAA family ATPase [Chloroflexota bacterium]